VATWALSPSQLPAEGDRLTRHEELLFYYLIWFLVHGRPVPKIDDMAAGLRMSRSKVNKGLRRLRDLGLLQTRFAMKPSWTRTITTDALRPV